MEYAALKAIGLERLEAARARLRERGTVPPTFLAVMPDGEFVVRDLSTRGPGRLADLARESVRGMGAVAAVIVGELQTMAATASGLPDPDTRGESIFVLCVHPDGRALWIQAFARERGITFGREHFSEGPEVGGDVTGILG